MESINRRVRQYLVKRYWRKINPHNTTVLGTISNVEAVNFIKSGGVTVGKRTYGKININYTCGDDEKLRIGNNCSISGKCNFLLGGGHDYKCISTYPLFGYEQVKAQSKGEIIVEDDVWIGDGAWILSGIRIGKGAIIGTGSIVTHDVPPYAIVAGNPAKVIKFRFSERIIDKIRELSIDYENLTSKQVKLLRMHLNDENVDLVVNGLSNSKSQYE